MQNLAIRPWITAGVALVGAGAIAVTPVPAPLPRLAALGVQLTSGEADMVLDLVRHGQSTDNVSGVMGTVPPGAALTDLGKTEAVTVGEELYNSGHNDIDGVYASEFLRTQQTAWPLLDLMHGASNVTSADIPDDPSSMFDPGHILSGLNELNAGFLEGTHETELSGLLYLAAPLAWMMGMDWVPQLGSTIDPNGMEFEHRFTDAVDTIYNNGGAIDDGDYHDVAFSHEMAITVWTMMSVKNPDFGILLKGVEHGGFLDNTGQVVIEGNPADGYTLVSWDGTAVPADPGLLTQLFIDWRDVITAPQMAFYNIEQAIAGGDSATITAAIQTGFDQVGAALMAYPAAVYDDIASAVQQIGTDLTSGSTSDLASDLSTIIIGDL